jgi:hypothetical protein
LRRKWRKWATTNATLFIKLRNPPDHSGGFFILVHMAGYAQTSLVKKLGIKPGYRVILDNAPHDYLDWISPLPEEVTVYTTFKKECDFIHLFVTDSKSFRKKFDQSIKHIKKDGMIWVSWPKKASKVVTDLDENSIRDVGLYAGLVDVKVCAVNEIWSALKFVIRLKDR